MGKIFNTFILGALSLYFCNGLVSCAYGQSLVFGPEFFSSESGKPRRVVKSFSVQDVNQKFFISVQSGRGNEEGVAGAAIDINGEHIVSSDELGKQFKMLTKTVTLQKQNDISVEVTGEADAPIVVTIMSPEEHTVTVKIPPIGEAVDLDGYATAIFPVGTFDGTQDVMLSATASPSTQNVFEANATGPRLPYEIRINSGDHAPRNNIPISLNVPDSFISSDYQIHVFVQMLGNPSAPDVQDRFFKLDSGLRARTKTVRVKLPKDAFSNRYGKNGTYEAIVTVGLIH